MIEGVRRWLTVAGMASTGLMGGVFFAFSAFVMTGLRRSPAEQGMRVMQEINRAATASPAFMLAFLGTPALCIAIGVSALADIGDAASAYQLIASALYLVGAFGLTMVYHVPRNNALDRLDPDAPSSIDAWTRYAAGWTAWNHVRTAAPIAASVLYALALRSA